jgi:hypothetical protein
MYPLGVAAGQRALVRYKKRTMLSSLLFTTTSDSSYSSYSPLPTSTYLSQPLQPLTPPYSLTMGILNPFKKSSAGSAASHSPSVSYGGYGSPGSAASSPGGYNYGSPGASYGSPGASYGSPGSSYGSPAASYGSPAASYGSPAASYGSPSGYSYGAPTKAYYGQGGGMSFGSGGSSGTAGSGSNPNGIRSCPGGYGGYNRGREFQPLPNVAPSKGPC